MGLSEEVTVLLACFFAGEDGLLRTKLQKGLYFASQKGILEDSFGRGYYGPFSPDIANSAESLVSANFLKECIEFFPDGKGYNYSLSSDGEKVIPVLKKQMPDEMIEELDRIIKVCKNHTTSSISIAAKVHYILKRIEVPMTADQIAKQAEKMRWSISSDEVLEASRLLKALELIE